MFTSQAATHIWVSGSLPGEQIILHGKNRNIIPADKSSGGTMFLNGYRFSGQRF